MGQPLLSARIDHVGIAAPSQSSPLVAMLGEGQRGPQEMPSGVTICRFGPGEMLELVSPRDHPTPVSNFLARRGPGLHHLAVSVDLPLASVLPQLPAAGIRFAGNIEPSSDGRLSLFVHPSCTGGVLIELVEGRR